jgi:hypothetical protein
MTPDLEGFVLQFQPTKQLRGSSHYDGRNTHRDRTDAHGEIESPSGRKDLLRPEWRPDYKRSQTRFWIIFLQAARESSIAATTSRGSLRPTSNPSR